MKRATAALTLIAALTACGETPTPTELELPPVTAAISDGAHQGNPHFFFLSPMVPAPSPEGVFDGGQEPTVDVCVWNGVECSASLDYFTTLSGPGSETIRVDLEDELYIVNWRTDEILESTPIDQEAGESYRIRVSVGARVLGYADVEVVAGGHELKNVSTGDHIPLFDGRTLPIKFRIEEGFDETDAVQTIGAGYWHGCAIDAQDDAWCWGRNAYGQLGTGTATGATHPQRVVGGLKWAMIATGSTHTCGLTLEGQAWCWGRNFYGQLGADFPIGAAALAPLPVQGDYTFTSIATSVGGYTTCGVTTTGEGLCWGYGRQGQIGNGTHTIDNPAPTPVLGSLEFESIRPGATHVCGLTASGEGYCWGSNVWGQLGQGPLYQSLVPIAIPGTTFQSFEAGYRHSCGVTTSGDAYCWGYNGYGAAGIGSRLAHVTTPTPVAGGLSFERVSPGGYLTCATQADGKAWCWGFNTAGGVGNGTLTEAETTPQAVVGGHLFTHVDAGYLFACGATTSGEAVCWGLNNYDQIGSAYGAYVPSPVPVLDLGPSAP